MKTVKIHCFSAINGEKTFVWNGIGELPETNRMVFRTDEDEYRFRFGLEDAAFERIGVQPLSLLWNRTGSGEARVSAMGLNLTLRLTILRYDTESHRFAVRYRIEGQTETHEFQLTWT